MITLLLMISLATAIIAPVSSDVPIIWEPPDTNRIPDGPIPDPSLFPYIAVIWIHNLGPQWNGFILDENRVITIMNCLMKTVVSIHLDWLSVRVGGVSWWDEGGEIHAFESVRFHPEYRNEGAMSTIAVVKVSRPFVWSPDVKPITIAAMPENSLEKFTLITWANTESEEESDLHLKSASIVIFDRQRCNTEHRKELKTDELCFFALHQRVRVADFDIGLPIICNETVVGMLNTEDDDDFNPMDPSTMLVISEYTEWIYSNSTPN